MTGSSDPERPTRRRVLKTGAVVTSAFIGGVGAVGIATSNSLRDDSEDCDPDYPEECPVSVEHPTNAGTVESVRVNEENGDVEIERQPMTSGGHIR